MPEGFFDIGDEARSGYGAEVLKELMARREADGDLLQG